MARPNSYKTRRQLVHCRIDVVTTRRNVVVNPSSLVQNSQTTRALSYRCRDYSKKCRSKGCQSFRTQVISYLLWSFHTYFLVISYPVTTISYPGHFVPILVISYLGQLGTKWLYGGQFVPKSFRNLFGHFLPIFGHFVPSKDGWMDGWMDGLTNGWTDVFWLKWQINVLLLIVT